MLQEQKEESFLPQNNFPMAVLAIDIEGQKPMYFIASRLKIEI